MIIDGRHILDGSVIDTDICIVGSGPAGMTLALRLAKVTNLRIMVAESGNIIHSDRSQELASGVVVGQNYFPLVETRLRRVGGSSWSWGGVLCQLDPMDFEERDWVPHSGWPISSSAIAGFYSEALSNLGFKSLCKSDGSRPHSASTSDDMAPAEIFFTTPKRFGRDHVAEFSQSKQIDLYVETTVLLLNPTQDGQRIISAEAGSFTGARFSIRARTYVIAGGGVENARLLMLTNRRHGTEIGNGSRRLGRYFMEHPRLADRLWINRGLQAIEPIVNGAADRRSFGRIGLTRDAQRREKLLNYHANLSFGYLGQEGPAWNSVRRIALAMRRPWSDSPYFQDAGGGRTKVYWNDLFRSLAHPANTATSIVASGLKLRRLRRFVSIISGFEQAPDPNNRIVLSDTRYDSFDQPQAEIHWSLGPVERKTYEYGLERVIAHLDMLVPGAKKARLDRARWGEDVLGTWHHIGTTRMSDQPSGGVVDTDLKVHGTDNLYVVGSSVFPTGGAAAPTFTIVALSLRLADHLCRQSFSPTLIFPMNTAIVSKGE